MKEEFEITAGMFLEETVAEKDGVIQCCIHPTLAETGSPSDSQNKLNVLFAC